MPRIITHTCPSCGTVVAGNVLEENRVTECPGLDCEEVVRFEDLDGDDRRAILEHPDRYTMEET